MAIFAIFSGSIIGVKVLTAQEANPVIVAQSKPATDEDLVCAKTTATNLLGNVGLFGDKDSLRQTLKDDEWGQYVDFLLARNYTPACTMMLLRAATKPQTSGPLPYGLISTYTKFVLQKGK